MNIFKSLNIRSSFKMDISLTNLLLIDIRPFLTRTVLETLYVRVFSLSNTDSVRNISMAQYLHILILNYYFLIFLNVEFLGQSNF